MGDVPSALLRINRLPEGVICLLREIAKGGGDPVRITLDILHRDETWLREVAFLVPEISRFPEDDWLPTFEGRAVPELAIATAVQRYMRNSLVSAELSRYWQYSLACAVACAELSACTKLNTAMAFSCGLLHDLGRLALMTAYPAQYANLFRSSERMLARNELVDISAQERLLFGFDRFETGEWLVGEWGLPSFFRQIVGKFQENRVLADANLMALTRAGTSLVYAFGYGLMLGLPRRSVPNLKPLLPPSVMGRFGPELDDLKQIIDKTLAHWTETQVRLRATGELSPT